MLRTALAKPAGRYAVTVSLSPFRRCCNAYLLILESVSRFHEMQYHLQAFVLLSAIYPSGFLATNIREPFWRNTAWLPSRDVNSGNSIQKTGTLFHLSLPILERRGGSQSPSPHRRNALQLLDELLPSHSPTPQTSPQSSVILISSDSSPAARKQSSPTHQPSKTHARAEDSTATSPKHSSQRLKDFNPALLVSSEPQQSIDYTPNETAKGSAGQILLGVKYPHNPSPGRLFRDSPQQRTERARHTSKTTAARLAIRERRQERRRDRNKRYQTAKRNRRIIRQQFQQQARKQYQRMQHLQQQLQQQWRDQSREWQQRANPKRPL